MLQNAPNCTIPKQIFGETCPQTPLANAWLRNASQATHPPPPQTKIVAPLGKSCIRPRTTEKFI